MSVYHAFTNVYTETLGMNCNKGHAKYCGSCILTLHFGKIHDVFITIGSWRIKLSFSTKIQSLF